MAAKTEAPTGAAIPKELVAATTKHVAEYNAKVALGAIADPAKSAHLSADAEWLIDEIGEVRTRKAADEASFFNCWTLQMMAMFVPYLYVWLPNGDPLRRRLPEVVARVRDRLASKTYLLWLGRMDLLPGDDPALRKKLPDARAKFFARMGGKSFTPESSKPLASYEKAELKPWKDIAPAGRDSGPFVAVAHTYQVSVAVRPSRIGTAEGLWDELKMEIGYYGSDDLSYAAPQAALDAMRSPGFDAMMSRVVESPVPEGHYEANPLKSAPSVVAAVCDARKLSETAAGLYLQTLALLSPTTKDVMRFNAWDAKQYAAAADELVRKKLVVEDKRPGSGRSHFLPGTWERAKDAPFETWKMPLYGLKRADDQKSVVRPLGTIVPLVPIHLLFTTAWERVQSGHAPK